MSVEKDKNEDADTGPSFPTDAELLDAGYVRANFGDAPDVSAMKTAAGHPFPTHEEIVSAGYVPLSRRTGRLTSRPRVSQMYWVDFHHDAYSPEFEREHPGIIIRAAQKLHHDTCIVLPVTSAAQKAGTHFHTLSWNPNTDGRKKGITAHVVCDHLYTVNTNRLRPLIWQGKPYFPRAYPEDMTAIFGILEKVLNASFTAIEARQAVAATELAAKPVGPNTLTIPSRR
ncbi:type II toxin-antitoxin system PemK/MazF family toxin [uncultured Roseobacter sp.]|uniref:type II toxin-antitoxin system PemK/MazF family toxin n=1 Tax=uncultured Roseobacter sp. TaxID=114847 RepID=UPI002632E193|nr:type II toxin-antitoxin system PemK/MazF family toxin [uncultured Roseobacter sp.]